MVYLGITYTPTEEEILPSPLPSSDQGHHRGNCGAHRYTFIRHQRIGLLGRDPMRNLIHFMPGVMVFVAYKMPE